MPTTYLDARLPTIACFILIALSFIFGIVSASSKGWAQFQEYPGGPEIRAGLWWYCVGKTCTSDPTVRGCASAIMGTQAFIVLAIMAQGCAGIGLVTVTGFQNAKFAMPVIISAALAVCVCVCVCLYRCPCPCAETAL